MSDFDKFFGERLNEETEFPLREKNWKALAQRLDTVVVGTAPSAVSVLKYWKVAAIGLALISAGLLWKVRTLQETNAALQQKIELHKTAIENNTVSTAGIIAPTRTEVPAALPAEGNAPHLVPASVKSFFVEKQQTAQLRPGGAHRRQRTASDLPAAAKRQNEFDLQALSSEQTAEVPLQAQETNGQALVPAAESVEAAPRSTDLPTAGVLVPLPMGQAIALVLPEHQADLPARMDVPVTRPFSQKAGRFRVGIQGTVAAPAPRPGGISHLRGAGVAMEYTPVRNLWLTASADGLSYKVQSNRYLPPSFFSGDQPKPINSHHQSPPPFPPSGPFPLVQVEGNQRVRMLSTGVRYVLPVRFWLKPSVQIAHTWLRTSPAIFSFTFEDSKPDLPPQQQKPPFSIPKSTEAQTIRNIWRMGVGLERETDNWVFRAGVDWVENGAATKPAFDALLVQGGVLYKF
jgi:hypothetical protein